MTVFNIHPENIFDAIFDNIVTGYNNWILYYNSAVVKLSKDTENCHKTKLLLKKCSVRYLVE